MERRYTLWEPDGFRLFVSHTSSHRHLAGRLGSSLRDYGISAFVAHNDIEPSLEWQRIIEEALKTCDALVALLTPDFHKSQWTDQEVGFVLGQPRLVLSIRLGLDPYGFIGKDQGVPGTRRPHILAGRVFAALCAAGRTCHELQRWVIGRLASSKDIDDAKRVVGFLEMFSTVTETQAEVIRQVIRANRHVRNSPRLVARLDKYCQRAVPG